MLTHSRFHQQPELGLWDQTPFRAWTLDRSCLPLAWGRVLKSAISEYARNQLRLLPAAPLVGPRVIW